MIIEKKKLKKMMRRSLVMIIIISFMIFCFESLAMLLANGRENVMILILVFIVSVIMILFLIYYNNVSTIYKVEYGMDSIIFYSTLKKHYITEQISLEETVKSFVIKTSGKRFIFPKHNRFPREEDRCYTSREMEKIVQSASKGAETVVDKRL